MDCNRLELLFWFTHRDQQVPTKTSRSHKAAPWTATEQVKLCIVQQFYYYYLHSYKMYKHNTAHSTDIIQQLMN